MKTFLKFIPVLVLFIISLYPLFHGSKLSTAGTDQKKETSSLPTSAKDVVVLVCDFSSTPGDALDPGGLDIISEIHTSIREMEGIRSYSSLLNTPVVKTRDDEILVLPFISADLLVSYDQNEITILRSQYDNFPEIWPYISRDFYTCAFYLEPGRTYPAGRLVEKLEILKEEVESTYSCTLDFTGLRPIRLFMERLLTQDIFKMFPVLFILISLLYVIVFRDAGILIISWCIKIIATASAFGFYLFFFKEISPLVIIIPVFNAGLLSDYLIHMFYHARGKRDPDSFYTARNFLALPLSLTALTSITGFLSLSLFESGGHLLLAITISASILITYLLALLWIPSVYKTGLLSVKPGKKIYRFLLKKVRRGLTLFFLLLFKKRAILLAVILLLLLVSLFNLPRLTLQPYPLKQLPQKSTIIKAENILNEKFSGTLPFMIEIDTGSAGSLLDNKELFIIEHLHHTLGANKEVGFQHSILTVIKKINFYFHNSDPEYFSIPFIEDEYSFGALIEQYLLFFSASTSPGEYESLVDPDYRIASIRGILKYSEPGTLDRFLTTYKQMKQSLPKGWTMQFLGPLKELIKQTDNLKSNWVLSFAVGSLFIFFTVLIFFKNLKMSFLSLLPSFFIIILVTGMAPVFGIRIDEYTIIFIAITMGLTIDYTIHILNAIQPLKTLYKKKSIVWYGYHIIKNGGVPVFLSFLTSVIAFAILFLSSFSGAVHLAVMLTVAISGAFFTGGFILPIFFAPAGTRKRK